MKNKKFTYVLGLLVLIVWGVILYRIIGSLGNDDEEFQPIRQVVKESYNDFEVTKDTTKLLLNYRDPFGLTTYKDTTRKVTVKPLSAKMGQAIIKQPFDWGFIKYSGYIRNPGSKKLIAVVLINGKTVMMAEGETAERVTLVKNLQDSIKVNFDHKSTYIKM
jgi:hypothetical protein